MASAPSPKPSLTFDSWRLQLRNDCQSTGKLKAFDALGDYLLQLLWMSGVDPTVRALSSQEQGWHTRRSTFRPASR